MLHVEPRAELFDGQLKRIYEGEERLLRLPQVMGADVILKRYFLSDSTNQQPLMKQEADCSVSVIQQPPLDGSKVAVWLYLQKGSKVANVNGVIVAEHNGYRHLWKMGMHEHKGDSAWANGISADQLRGNLTKLAPHCTQVETVFMNATK